VANEADVVAVVNADGDRIAIWHVVLSPSYRMSRLSAAWGHASACLVATRLILPFGGQMPTALTHLASASAGRDRCFGDARGRIGVACYKDNY
jgi:hypothetical protein